MKHARRTLSPTLLAAAVSLLLSMPALAGQQSALPCSGYWMLESGQTQTIMGPGGGPGEKSFEMQVMGCGDQLVMYGFGSDDTGTRKVFQRSSRTPNTYNFSKTFYRSAGGRSFEFPVTVRLSQQTPAQMNVAWDFTSGMATTQGTASYLGPLPEGTMALLATECKGESDDAFRIDDPKTPEEARALARGKQLFETVLAVVGESVLETADKPLRDYITIVPAPDANGKTRVMLRVANDGSLLPDPGSYAMDHTRCVVDEREYVPTDSLLYFTAFELVDTGSGSRPTTTTRVTKNPDGTQTSSRQSLDVFYDTQLQQVDFETGKITKAQYASSSEPGDMQESVEAVMQAMQLGPFRLNDGFAGTGQ